MTTALNVTASESIRQRHADAVLAGADDAIARMAWDRSRIREHQQARLRTLLEHAIERSAFHRPRLAGVDPSTFTLDDLPSLPTMRKSEMMRAFDDVVTDPRIDRRAVDEHLSGADAQLRYLFDEYVVMASGGTSGERGVFVYGFDAATEFVLSVVRPSMSKLMALGVTPANPISAALVAAGTTLHGTAFVGSVTGEGGPVRMTTIPATLPLAELVRRLEAVQPLLLVGYPTTLARLAVEQASGRLQITPLAVSATSEPLGSEARRSIEAAFGVPVSNTFGSTEGLCGVGMPGGEAICFAEDTCIVELVDEDGRPVSPGEPSAKVLVTNLANLTQPLIRYELTDRFTEVPGSWPDGYLRATVEGRNDDPLRFGDVDVHPLAVRSVLVKEHAITEYQVRQRPNGIHVLAVAPDGLDHDALITRLDAALSAAGLVSPEVTVDAVERIERDELTGKARRFVPLD
jgi:phenylacetate-CoA ligase